MTKIELYKKVMLTKDYEKKDVNGNITIYKKGLTGLTIDFTNNEKFIIVDIDSEEYSDSIPALPIELLEYV